MKIQLKKKKLKNLSRDASALPAEMTPQVAGGTHQSYGSCGCNSLPWEGYCNTNTCY